MSKYLITRKEGRILAASWDGSHVTELLFEEEAPSLRIGDIYLGRVKDVIKNLQAAFVEVKPGILCFLPMNQEELKTIHAGDILPVVVEKEAQKTKDPVVSRRLSLAGRTLVLVSDRKRTALSSRILHPDRREALKNLLQNVSEREDIGFIVRTNAETAEPEEILAEAEQLSAVYKEILEKVHHRTVFSCLYESLPAWKEVIRDAARDDLEEVVTDQPDLWEDLSGPEGIKKLAPQTGLRLYRDSYPLEKLYRLDHFLEKALSRYVWLKSGGSLVIDYTEAMTVIDVNTGKYEGRKQKEGTLLLTNLEAAREIAFQLRLRNLSGMILVDFIDMEQQESKDTLLETFSRELAGDPCHARVVDMTALGIVEVTRKKVRKPLHEQLRGETKKE